jgi:F5/8 type C domain
MADPGARSFWRTHGALGLIVALIGLAGVAVPLVLTRGDDGSEPEPSPTATATATATATSAPVEPELLGRGRYEAAASSTLAPDAAGNRYDAALAKDGDTRTAWSEGAPGAGVGEWLEFSFDSPVKLTGIELVNGYAKNRGLYRRNGRLSQVRVVTDGGSRRGTLRDGRMDFQPVDLRAGRTESVRIVIDGVFGGERYEDTLVSEVRLRVAP